MFNAIVIPGERGVFVPPIGMVLADSGYLQLPNGKYFHYRFSHSKPISDSEPRFVSAEAFEKDIPADENVLLMIEVQALSIKGRLYFREDRQPFEEGQDYRLPDGKLYFCLRIAPKPAFLACIDNEPSPRILGSGTKQVYDLILV